VIGQHFFPSVPDFQFSNHVAEKYMKIGNLLCHSIIWLDALNFPSKLVLQLHFQGALFLRKTVREKTQAIVHFSEWSSIQGYDA
jgi:hypothetical protein